MINTRVMRWSSEHRDHYAYFEVGGGEWQLVKCLGLKPGMRCTAPFTMPRGTQFDYNGKLQEEEG